MGVFKNILEYKNNSKSLNLYLGKKENDHQFTTLKLNKEQFKRIKTKLKNKSINSSFKQIETKFRNLSKIELIYNNSKNEITYYNNLFNDFQIHNDYLLLNENKESIDNHCFPSLENYDSIDIKYFDVYNFKNFNLVFVTQNDETTVYFNFTDTTTLKPNNEKEFEEVKALLY